MFLKEQYIKAKTAVTYDQRVNAAIAIISNLKGMDYVRGCKKKQMIPIAIALYEIYKKKGRVV